MELLAIITRFFFDFVKIPESVLLTIEFLLKEKLLSGDKTFGYTLRFADICGSTDTIL